MSQLKRVAIVGRDAEGWLSALMLQKSLSAHNVGLEVVFIELPPEFTGQDFFSVLPSHKLLHDMLGAKEQTLLRLSGGMYSFGQRYSNWQGNNTSYLHSYDRFGVDFNHVPFYHYWQKAADSGLKLPMEAFNLGAAAALAGRYVVFEGTESTFSNATYGYQFEARAYVAAVAKAAMFMGLKHYASPIDTILADEEGIESITLVDGSQIIADLFIDASGSESILIKRLDHQGPESWKNFFPVDKLIVASSTKLEPLPSFSQITAFNAGWIGMYPLLNKTAINIAYSSHHSSTEEVLERAAAIIGRPIENATESGFEANNRPLHWIKNCIALGGAATNLEPLDASQLHLLHLSFSLLRELFPQSSDYALEAKIFNEKMRAYAEGMRDFMFARYHLNKRYDDEFWRLPREQALPEILKSRLELFASRGVISQCEDDVFLEEDWYALLVGSRERASILDPLMARIPNEELMAKFQQLLIYIKAEVEKMPLLQSYTEMTL